MTLTDLRPTLQQHLELPWVFDLHESLNARLSDESWVRSGSAEVGTGTIDDETFRIVLEPGTYPIDGIQYRFVNVAFQKIVNGLESEELQWTSSNASKIVGAISNALLDRVQLYDFDGVLFIAADNVQDRMRVYNRIADRKWVRSGLGITIKDIDLGHGARGTALLSKELGRQKHDEFITFLKGLSK